jgi:hypothetical protein
MDAKMDAKIVEKILSRDVLSRDVLLWAAFCRATF